jgi:hypothetical protein
MLRSTVACVLAAGLGLALTTVQAGETAKAIMPFNGSDLKGWKLKGPQEKSHWVVGQAQLDPDNPAELKVTKISAQADGGPAVREMINAKHGGLDIYSEEKFGDATIELEVMVPKGSNSGIYVMGEYEIQVLDSYKRAKVGPGDMGGLYGASAPSTNACKAPGEWQKFVIQYQAPRFRDGKKTENAKFLKITLNGTTIHENVEMKGATPGGVSGREAETGPLMFQGNHGAVAYRNIKIYPKK